MKKDSALLNYEPVVGPNGFGTILKFGVKRAAIKQMDLAVKLGVTPVQVSHWINQTAIPKEETIAKIWYGLEGFLILPHPDIDPQLESGSFYGFTIPFNRAFFNWSKFESENLEVLMNRFNEVVSSLNFVFPEQFRSQFRQSDFLPTDENFHHKLRSELFTRLIREYKILEEQLESLERTGFAENIRDYGSKKELVQQIKNALLDMQNSEKFVLRNL